VGVSLYQKVEIFAILAATFTPPDIGVKFCTAKWTHVLLGRDKFHMNWCNESPLCGENADFRPVSKFKYQLTLLRGVLPVNIMQVSHRIINELASTHT